MAILLITHDLGVVAEMADEVAIMYAGRIVERAPAKTLFANRSHPYTDGLFASIPKLSDQGRRLRTIKGQVPAATDFPPGCRFHPRCPKSMDICSSKNPPTTMLGDSHSAACWLFEDGATAQGDFAKSAGNATP